MSAATEELKKTVIYKSAVIKDAKAVSKKEAYRTGARICLERARLITESYKETEGQPEVIRRARALARILGNMTVYIRGKERIVGNFASDPGGMPVFPELSIKWVDECINVAPEDMIGDEDRKLWRDIYAYWDGKCLDDRVMAIMPDSIKPYVEGNNVCEATTFRAGIIGVSPNFNKVLRVGLNGIIGEIEAKLGDLKADMNIHPADYVEQRNFLEAALISCQAVIRFAHRLADKATEMAKSEPDTKRARELEEIAQVGRQVPANPARTLHEAMQSWWIVFLINRLIEAHSQGIGIRLDQVMYPYYKKGIEDGSITREQAQELMEFLLVKLEGCGHLLRPTVHDRGVGATMYITLTLGGTNKDGEDATNEFSFIMLDAAIAMKTIHTNYALRYHSRINHDFILRAIDLVRTGVGYPAFFNDSGLIPLIVDRGIPLEDARDYVIRGCVIWLIPGKNSHNHRASSADLSLGKCLELALNQGIDMLSGEQIGYTTPDPGTFNSFEDVKNAYFKQVDFVTDKITKIINLADSFGVQYVQLPFSSAVIDGCIERSQDLNAWTYHSRPTIKTAGDTNVADSLAAIKKFVFDEKRLTMKDLVDALKTDFEGKEELRQRLINEAPKFGNDDDYVDYIKKEIHHGAQHLIEQYKSWWGDPWSFDGSMVAAYYFWGKKAAASADGRKTRDSFADAVLSPMAGRDRKGPTAVLNSMGKVTPLWTHLFNQKFLPQFLEGENKERFAAYLKTWGDMANTHIQFNVADRETLLDAQIHPEKHVYLTVRVAGYSAYFVDLSKGVQDDIIARVGQSF